MGNIIDNNIIVGKEDVFSKIEQINEITKKYTIIHFLGLYLQFSYNEDFFTNFTKKTIKVEIPKYDSKLQKIEENKKIVQLTIEEFYNYYNALMNSLNIFIENKLSKKLESLDEVKRESFGYDESSFCPICEENKVDISLPCSHFFCEKCIKTWASKSGTCPLCRIKIEYNKQKENTTPAGIDGSERWFIITKDEETNQEIKKKNVEILLKLTKDLFDNS